MIQTPSLMHCWNFTQKNRILSEADVLHRWSQGEDQPQNCTPWYMVHVKHSVGIWNSGLFRFSEHPRKEEERLSTTVFFHLQVDVTEDAVIQLQINSTSPLHSGALWYLYPDNMVTCGSVTIQWGTENVHWNIWLIYLLIVRFCSSSEYN